MLTFFKENNQIIQNEFNYNELDKDLNISQPENLESLPDNAENQSFLYKILKVPKLSSDKNFSFNFKKSNWFSTFVFISTFILSQVIYSLVKTYAYGINSITDKEVKAKWELYDFTFFYLIPIIGLITVIIFDWKTIFKKGAIAAYIFFILRFPIAIISHAFKSSSHSKENEMSLVNLIVFIVQIMGAVLVFATNKQLRKQVYATLKEAKLNLLYVTIIFFIIGFVLQIIINHIINIGNNTKNLGETNQENLEKIAKTPFGLVVIIFLTIIGAPIYEEIYCRYGIFSIVKNRWLAFFVSAIYFPAIHVMQTGTWNAIGGYTALGILLPLIFILTRGNLTYTISLHSVWNVSATIDLVIKIYGN